MNKAHSLSSEEFRSWNEGMSKKYDPDRYHASTGIVGWVERSRVEKLLRLLSPSTTDHVLEVGVGAGNILASIHAQSLAGIDLSTYLLEKARLRLPNAELVEGNAEELEKHFPKHSFDKVFCSEVLEHVQHPDRVLRSMAHVVSPTGVVVVSVPNEHLINRLKSFLKVFGVFRLLLPSVADHMEDEWHLHLFGRDLLRRLASESFDIERIVAAPFSFLPIRLIARLRPRVTHVDYENSLVCPDCRVSLLSSLHTFSCPTCTKSYPIIDGVPQLLEQLPSSLQRSADGSTFKNYFKRYPWLYGVLFTVVGPCLLTGLTSARFVRRFTQYPRVLYAGSGPRRIAPHVLNCDIAPYPGVDVVADLQALPFSNSSFDAVTCEQVLEHVRRPYRAAEEIRRVVRPGGLIHIAVPFVFPWHPSPSDYTRWTIEGLCDLFSDCTVVEKGVIAGPFSMANAVVPAFLSIILSFGFTPLRNVLEYVFLVLFAPLKLLDLVFAHVPGAERVAADVYVVLRTLEDA